jgi:plasmid stabilization system protein ParE
VTEPRLDLIVWDQAARQIEEAAEWWRGHREGSPDALYEELVRAFDLICRQPGIGIQAERRRLREIRRVLLPRVGYFLFYRVAPRKDVVEVLAFWHSRRGSPPSL